MPIKPIPEFFLCRHRLFFMIAPFTHPRLEKNDPHIRVPVAFLWPGWVEIPAKNRGCPEAFNGRLTGGKSAVFFQIGHDFGVFSTRTKKAGNAGFFGTGPNREKGKRRPKRAYF